MVARVTGKRAESWGRLNELFFYAVHLQGAEREAYIQQQTRDDPELQRELRAMLDAGHRHKTGSLTRTLGSIGREEQDNLVGRVIANYRLTSVLGRGGAGTVFLGERADRQFSANVAVKVIDRSAAADLGMRFRAERQILANLNHPNIARLVDAGETQDGRPYLVMEYVEGQPVDRYCDEQRLDLRARLALFMDICAAVQYAHQNLIVHRDLKPANILVTTAGVPKLLDFGIAKLLNTQNAGATSELTRVHDRLLTPEYASPEQVRGSVVTTASDVYSLGVVLYRLLTGLRPYDLGDTTSPLELERAICHADPPRPSAAVLEAINAGPSERETPIAAIAAARGLVPEVLRRRLAGDIDAIVMRALRKEPEHRYSSVERLVADIRHYLSDEPVQARQGNWLYYSQRFVRRHTAGVIAGAGFLAFVMAVAVVMSIQRQNIAAALEQATHDRERAEKVSQFMLDVFSAADPYTNFGREPTARILLDQAARQIKSDLNQQPEVRARLLEAIGRSYRRMGQPDRAVVYLQDSLRIREQLAGADETRGSIVTEIALALRHAGRIEESEGYFNEALQISRSARNQQSEGYAQLLVEVGRFEKLRSNPEAALVYLRQALELTSRLKGPEHQDVAAILAEISNILVWSDDLDGAEQAAQQAVRIYQRLPEFHPDRVIADSYLADILFYRGRIEEAALLYEKVLGAQRHLYGPANNVVADTLGSLAQVRLVQDKVLEAERLIREALAAHTESGSAAYLQIGYLQTMLATTLMRLNKAAEAERVLRATLDLFAKNIPSDHQYVASAEHYLGEALLGQAKFSEAQGVLLAAMDRWQRTGAPAWRAARSGSALGEALYRQGNIEQAERYLVDSYRELAADPAADRDSIRTARERLVAFYTQQGQRQKLNALLSSR